MKTERPRLPLSSEDLTLLKLKAHLLFEAGIPEVASLFQYRLIGGL